jgi:hypothetical protein
MRYILLLFATAWLVAASPIQAADLHMRSRLAPFREQPAPHALDPVQRGKAQLYDNQLQNESRHQELDRDRGQLPARDNNERLQTQHEMNRMDNMLGR